MNYDDELKKYETSSANDKSFKLPDGNVITVGNQRFRCPELLFNPSFTGKEYQGIHELTFQSII